MKGYDWHWPGADGWMQGNTYESLKTLRPVFAALVKYGGVMIDRVIGGNTEQGFPTHKPVWSPSGSNSPGLFEMTVLFLHISQFCWVKNQSLIHYNLKLFRKS